MQLKHDEFQAYGDCASFYTFSKAENLHIHAPHVRGKIATICKLEFKENIYTMCNQIVLISCYVK